VKILIYTTHRTGSTSLAELLMTHFNCDYQREGFFKNANFLNKINVVDNIIIKLTPFEANYNDIKHIFDKRIILTRNNIIEQAESRVYSENTKKSFVPYTIDDTYFDNRKDELDRMVKIINTENDILNSCDDCLHITYEELYYSKDGIIKLEEYLNTKIKFKLDSSKRYRNTKKTLI
jgi:hypothetical protein